MSPIQEKQISPFLKYFPIYIKNGNLTFHQAHGYLMRSISELLALGWKYEECIKIEQIYKARDYIARVFDKRNYAYANKMISFVFTQDNTLNPFGPWKELDHLDALAVLELAYKLKTEKNSRLHLLPLAGVLFAILKLSEMFDEGKIESIKSFIEQGIEKDCFPPLTKVKKQKVLEFIDSYQINQSIGLLEAPTTLYGIANVCQPAAKDYLEFLGIQYIYESYRINEDFKTRLWLGGFQTLLESFDEIWSINGERYKKILTVLNETVADRFNFYRGDPILTKMCNNYEHRFIRDKDGYFNHPALYGNPFIRKISDRKIACQLEFFDFEFLLYSLYWDLANNCIFSSIKDNIDKKIAKALELKFKDRRDKNKDELKKILLNRNMARRVYPITSCYNPKQNGAHFKLINRVKDIVSEISKTGILVDSAKAKVLFESRQELLNISEDNASKFTEGYDPDYEIEAATDGDRQIEYFRRYDHLYSSTCFESLFDCSEDYDEYASMDNNINPMLSALSQKEEWSFTKIQNDIDQLIKIISSSKEDFRIRGLFTPHGAKSHRMTCSNINLQGLAKVFRKELFKASPGYSLISADVSGQDITVAANLALKVYNDPVFIDRHNEEELMLLREKIETTLGKLSQSDNKENAGLIHKPIDFITNKIDEMKLEELNGFDIKEIRKLVKGSVYVRFYGGGKSTIKKEHEKASLEALNDQLKQIEHKVSFLGVGINYANLRDYSFEDLYCKLGIELVDLENNELIKSQAPSQTNELLCDLAALMNYCEKCKKDIEIETFVFNLVGKLIKEEYPGLLEVHKFLEEYVTIEENPLNLSYPSLLGWQTVIDVLEEFDSEKRSTRSKSYPIQASGTEFIWQWLINLSNVPENYRVFKIVNVIHDQIIIEVKNEKVKDMQLKLVLTAIAAAKEVGIRLKTLHLPLPEILCES